MPSGCPFIRFVWPLRDVMELLCRTEHSQKAAQKSKKEGIGADDFVPIFLFVTIHAELPTPFQVCTCIKRFASDTERNSEVCNTVASQRIR